MCITCCTPLISILTAGVVGSSHMYHLLYTSHLHPLRVVGSSHMYHLLHTPHLHPLS